MVEALTVGYQRVMYDGNDISSYIMSYSYEIPQSGIRTANIVTKRDIELTYTMTAGKTVEIYESSDNITFNRVFYGQIVAKTDDITGYAFSCSDELWKATGYTITKLYDVDSPTDPFGGDIRLIMFDMTAKAKLIMDDTTMDQTAVIIPQVLCDSVKVYEKMNQLSQILYWDLYQEPTDRKIYCKNPLDYPTFPINFEVGKNVTESPKYDDNIYQTCNEVEMQGVQAYPSYVETFTGDGSKTIFTISKKPIATYVKVTVAGVVKSGAVEGSSGTYDYLVNLNQGIITFTTAPAIAATILIEYTVSEMINITVDSAEGKLATQGTRKLVVVLSDVSSVTDATQRAEAILEESKDIFSNFTIKAYNADGVSPRYKLNFYDPIKNRTYVDLAIVKVKKSWPEPTTEITVGKNLYNYNNLIMKVEERVKKLERTSREGVLLRINKLFNNNMYFVIDDVEIKRTPIGSVQQFLLDDPVYGLLDLNYLDFGYGPTKQFILGDATWGVLSTNNLGQEVPGDEELLVKRRYKWNTVTELAEGTADGNIDTSNGDIRFI